MQNITLHVINLCISTLKDNKSPGDDGLTYTELLRKYRIPITQKYFFHNLKIIHIQFKKSCVFCNNEPETVLHLFSNCHYVSLFWTDMDRFVRDHIGLGISLNLKGILFFCMLKQALKAKEFLLLNLLILFGRFHIHKAEWTGGKNKISTIPNGIWTLYENTDRTQESKGS